MDIKNTGTIDTRRESAATASSGASRSEAAAARPASAESGAPPGTGSSADRLTLTVAARSILELGAGSAGATPVDKARVAELRQAIAEGSYRIDPDRIAAALVRHDNS